MIELFKRLFNGLKQQIVGYAKEGVLYGVDADGKQQQLNPQQAESYVSSHPYDLSGYAQLTLTAKKLEKDKELRHDQFLTDKIYGVFYQPIEPSRNTLRSQTGVLDS